MIVGPQRWSEREWRLHRWAYARLTEAVDAQIGRVLAALRETGQEENTVVLFSSDHGDNDAARKTEHKSLPYEESCRVPFIVSQKGVTHAGAVDGHLLSNGLDILPTICDYAGIAAPADLRGRSVRPLAEGKTVREWREHLVVESQIARMVRNERYKYIVFSHGARRFQLFDLQQDPYETTNRIADPALKPVADDLHARLVESVRAVGDRFGAEYVPVVRGDVPE